jgi:hypothetical protein
MEQFRFRYLVCEFLANQLIMFPKGSKLPKAVRSKIRINGKYLYKKLNELCEIYCVEPYFCKDRVEAQEKAIELLNKAYNILDGERHSENN